MTAHRLWVPTATDGGTRRPTTPPSPSQPLRTVSFVPRPAYQLAMDDLALAAYQVDYLGRPAHAAARPAQGRNALEAGRPRLVGGTDMGCVSHLIPSIHPMIQVSPAGVPIHEPASADHAGGGT